MEQTIDLGIDLGTTNSVVAMCNENNEIEIVKHRNTEITPSMVAYDQRGTEKVGLQAKASFGDPRRGPDVQAEFKRKMGLDVKLHFQSSGIEKSPEELSASVLNELRRAVESRYNRSPRAAVITVPAMFELPQNEATARAAQLAGFEHAKLLQEPVAAAIAYGMTIASENAIWSVYDFGGGTFDTSLLRVSDGVLEVVGHAGNNYLGGADFDWAIIDQILLPEIAKSFDISSLKRHDSSDRRSVGRLRRLKALAEEVKIELSSNEQAELYREPGEVFDDDADNPVELEITLTRDRFNELAADTVDKSVEIMSTLFRSSGYQRDAIERVLLVGGSTFVPIVRERVGSLGIPLSLDLDPMTVVARGAAVFASTQTLHVEDEPQVEAKANFAATITLQYEKITKQASPLVGGRVDLESGASTEGYRLTIERDDKGFTTGGLTLDPSGMFFANVQVRDASESKYQIKVHDANGTPVATHPSEFTIRSGVTVSDVRLPSGCQLALADGTTKMLVKAGTALPVEVQHEVKTTKELKAGSEDDIVVSFLSGDEPRADHNLVGSRIRIPGNKINRDIPVGSLIEVILNVDESCVPKPRVYVSRLDAEFEPDVDQRGTELVHESPEVMTERLAGLRRQCAEVTEQAHNTDSTEEIASIEHISTQLETGRIEDHIQAWNQGDNIAAGRARNELVQVSKDLDLISEKLKWPTVLEEFRKEVAEALELLVQVDQVALNDRLQKAIAEGETAEQERDVKMLRNAINNIHRIVGEALRETPQFWIEALRHCARNANEFPEQARATQLLADAESARLNGDFRAMRAEVEQLMSMLPRGEEILQSGGSIVSDVR